MDKIVWWASQVFWKKAAIFVTGFMSLILVILTFDTTDKITAGSKRVPAYSVINNQIDYKFSETRNMLEPVIGSESPLFGKVLSEEEAANLINIGKLTIQAKNCMNCHTLLGNGAYYAPDLTKAWLDPSWGAESVRETLMLSFLMHPDKNARTFGTNRRMPNLGLSEAEAKSVIAYLKWMSSIDTNGFPANFKQIEQKNND
jgi:nitric oxide reductase subunit C